MILALLALASGAPLSASLVDISVGDEAWWAGERGDALAAWRRALAAADTSAVGRAAEVMARVRLLQLTGNLAPFVHERKMSVALGECPMTEPWCHIAAADVELFMPAFTGADPHRIPELVKGSPLVGPAAARVAAATGDIGALAGLADAELDGMGRGILEQRRRLPRSPGTWVLGAGIGGAPGAGVGFLLRFVDPDVAWAQHRLEVVASADTRGGFYVASGLRTAGRTPLSFGLSGGRSIGDLWADGAPQPWSLLYARGSAAINPRWSGISLLFGASARIEASTGVGATAGPYAALSFGEGDVLRLSADTAFGAYTHVLVGADWRGQQPLGGGTLALHTSVAHVPTPSPFWRLPSAGGSDVLRGLSAGRYRVQTLVVGQVEYRHVLIGPLYAAGFLDSAWADGGHVTAGVGLRIVLPPDRENTTRLDFGAGPEGWGFVVAWGEAF